MVQMRPELNNDISEERNYNILWLQLVWCYRGVYDPRNVNIDPHFQQRGATA